MLTKFSVKNFKNFKERLVLDFSNTKEYEFQKNLVKDKILTRAIIYGQNASGKSNLGLALFDIVLHITDKEKKYDQYNYYKNAETNDDLSAEFCYEFSIKGKKIKYTYQKQRPDFPICEELTLDDKVVVKHDHNEKEAYIDLDEIKDINKKIENPQLSVLKYIKNSGNYPKTGILKPFFDFIDGMLWIKSIGRENYYMGYTNSALDLNTVIAESEIKKFEKFLNTCQVQCHLGLIPMENVGRTLLAFTFKDEKGKEKKIPFQDIASSGTRILWLFYCWLNLMKPNKTGNKVSFLFIDEFDAYYHQKLSEIIVKMLLKEKIGQVVLTTHTTSLMSNDLLRPDCYLILDNNRIRPIFELTDKELRQAHNLEKMYKAGVFNG